MKNRLKTLEEWESYHSDMLGHIRAMIAAERGQSIEEKKSNGVSEAGKPFSKLTKAEAVTQLLAAKKKMHVSKIFSSMKRRGHPIKSKNSLSNMLSTDTRFQKKGGGIWALAENEKAETMSGPFRSNLPSRLNG